MRIFAIIGLFFANIFLLQQIRLTNLDMNLIDRLIEILHILTWPLTLIFCLKLFEHEIRNFIARLKSFSVPGGVGAEAFESQQKVEENKKIEALALELDKKKNLEQFLIKTLDEKEKTVKEYQLLLHFEKSYRLIFGSQLNILIQLRKQLADGLDIASVVLMYRASGWYERGYQIDSYFAFLTNSGFIEYNKEGNKYRITALGIVFLDYLQRENIPLNKPF